MSSTLLYLAIVAVWAVVLVPMWLHRDTDTTTGFSRLLNRRPQPSDYDDLGYEEETNEYTTLTLDGPSNGFGFDDVDREDFHPSRPAPRDDRLPEGSPRTHDRAGNLVFDESAFADLDDFAGSARPRPERPRPEAPSRPVRPTYARSSTQQVRPRRAAIIARRRRRTTGLALLTLTAPVLLALSLAPWWITIPPTILLFSHLALLRTATKLDAARRETARQLRQSRLEARRQAQQAAAEAAADTPDAEVIAFTARPQDVFDQYAEDTPRAVND